MEQAQFEALIERMERFAIERPVAYRRRVYGLAALGYGYLLFVVLVLLALCALAIMSVLYVKVFAVKLLLVIGALLIAVLRSLWVKQEPPKGERVNAADAPELFGMLRQLQQRLHTPAIHAVLVTTDFNAAVSQVPRLGVFGWHRNYLLLGLPLMKGLTVEQFKAVLGHELGHLSRGHARVANWIYRMRVIWAQLESAFERKNHWGSGLIRQFFKWYIPYFNAISFPFARANEYEADAASVTLTSARDTAQALINVHVIGSYLAQAYWPAIHATAKEIPEPSFAPYSGFVAAAAAEAPKSDLERWHDAALSEATSHMDTHPALSDRLKAIGATSTFAPPLKGEGADQLLGPALKNLENTFDVRWRDGVLSSWQKYHSETQAKRARLTALRAESAATALNEDGSLEMAALEEEVGAGAAGALALLRDAVARFPDSRLARYSLGRNLLREGQEEGVALIEGVIVEDPSALLAGSELLRDYFRQRGDHADGKRWHGRYVEEAARLQGIQIEREQIRLSDRFGPHELESQEAARLTANLKAIKGIKRAYLVRKIDPRLQNERLYVLGIKSTGWMQLHSNQRAERVIAAIQKDINFPGQTTIINVDSNRYKFARKMRRVKRAKLV